MKKKPILDVYYDILKRAKELKGQELSGDGYLELMWVAEELEKTEEINPKRLDS